MNANEFQEGLKMDDELQRAFTSYQKQFKAALEESAEMLRQAIVTAQQSIADQLEPGLLEQAQANLTKAVEFRSEPVTAKAVDQAFARARDVWDKVESAAAQAQPGLDVSEPALPAAEHRAEPVPADPLAATQSLISNATQSLNSAMEAVMKAMNSRAVGLGQSSEK